MIAAPALPACDCPSHPASTVRTPRVDGGAHDAVAREQQVPQLDEPGVEEVELDRLHRGDRVLVAGRQQLGDAIGAVRRAPLLAELVRPARRLVRRDDGATAAVTRGIERARHLLAGERLGRPRRARAVLRQQPRAPRAARDRAAHAVADAPRAAREDEVERRARPAPHRRLELGHVARAVGVEQRPHRLPALEGRRAQRDRPVLAGQHRPDHRPVPRLQHGLLDARRAAHRDALDAHGAALPALRGAVALRVVGIELLDVAVADVGEAGGDAPTRPRGCGR